MDDFDLDPEAVRRLGYRAADLVADHRAGLLQRPVFGKVGDAVIELTGKVRKILTGGL